MSEFGRSAELDLSRLAPPRRSQLLIRELPPCDPFTLYACLRQHAETSFIFESAPGPKRLAEFTYLGFDPRHIVTFDGAELLVDGEPIASPRDPLRPLETIREAFRPPLDVRMPKYLGGLVGYVGYDVVRRLEPSLARSDDDRPGPPFPELEFGLFLDGVIVDHRRGRAFYVSHGEDRFERVEAALAASPPEPGPFSAAEPESDTSQAAYERNVERAKRAVHDGEVYQMVLSRQLAAPYDGDLFEVYRALRTLNPSPYMFCLEFDREADHGRTIVGSSPEMLVSVREGRVVTYPIAGTRPLGGTDAEHERYRQELLSDEKEAAEHAMLVDLGRNDVGRVSTPGSVRVPEFRAVEDFSHVQHLVSRVEGELHPDCHALDALAALFPAGTVTGAPKVRAMAWIDELETSRRGPYSGAVGYASLTGDLDTAIAIRTLFATRGRLHLQAGAGIVADSDPEREWHETEHKLGALARALKEGSHCAS